MADTIIMPKLGFDMAEGTLVRWVRNEGESILKGDVLAEIETDKATVEVESSAGGVVLRHLVEPGAVVPVSEPIAIVGEKGEKVDLPSGPLTTLKAENTSEILEASAPAPAQPSLATDDAFVKASPLAKKIAHEQRVDLSNVVGSGPGGRIVRRDIELALSAATPKINAVEQAAVKSGQLTSETVPMSKLRQAIGRRLVESKQQIPHFYVTHDYKMETLLDLRKQINASLPEGEKLSVNDFIVKGVALSLKKFPNLNASLQGNSVIRHGEVNIGNAVAVEGGLLTVVCREADKKTLREISIEVRGMASRVRSGKVRPDDIEGSTFSISNLGMFAVEDFVAIINPPEVAILAVGAARETPIVDNGEIKPGWRMKATISVDHRVSDGAEAAQFMQALGRYLEQPVLLLI